eukprot:TRINITY_DN746_c0_g1_i1.p1 TRINITY_DN746_c0_g1~~TRINITY_DN746_c0_g1_i1.p1  ORF type:complete len:730 (-),score=128.44 TRINITY_DN746_c0_g1_i1:833-3022(-)
MKVKQPSTPRAKSIKVKKSYDDSESVWNIFERGESSEVGDSEGSKRRSRKLNFGTFGRNSMKKKRSSGQEGEVLRAISSSKKGKQRKRSSDTTFNRSVRGSRRKKGKDVSVSTMLEKLPCEVMSTDEFKCWLADNFMERYNMYFKKAGLFSQSTRRNVLQVHNANIDQLYSILFLPKRVMFHDFFDRTEFINIFLLTYPLFTSEKELLNKIRDSYSDVPFSLVGMDIETKHSILTVLDMLIGWDYNDFDKSLKMDVYDFLCFVKLDFPNYSLKYTNKITNLTKIEKNPGPLVPGDDIESLTLLDIAEVEMARQLTRREMKYFKVVNRKEILKGNISKETTPKLFTLLQHQQRTENWVKTEILRRGNAKLRSEVIQYFLNVSKELDSLRNYSTLSQVTLALNSMEIQKLKCSWNEEMKSCLDNYLSFIFDDQYSGYLAELESLEIGTSYIPIITYPCEMITKLNEVLDTYVDNNTINWSKMHSYFTIFKKGGMIRILKKYPFQGVPVINQYLDTSEVWDNEDARWEIANHLLKKEMEYQIMSVNDLWREMDLTEESVMEIIHMNSSKVKFKNRAKILEEGRDIKVLYQIHRGRASVFKDGEKKRVLSEGSFIGFEAFLFPGEEKKSSMSYVAHGGVSLYEIKTERILDICERHSRFSKTLNHLIAYQMTTELDVSTVPCKKKKEKTQSSLIYEKEFGIRDQVILFGLVFFNLMKNCHVNLRASTRCIVES